MMKRPRSVSETIELYKAPQDKMVEKLTDIWSELFSIDCIKQCDDFFALGGDSLLAMQLLAELKEIGLDTSVKEVFGVSNLAMLDSMLDRYNAATVPPNLITNESTKITPEMLLLITLTQADIDLIIAQVPGGIANIQDIYGLTPLQNDILYHHLIAKQSDPYLMVNRLHFIDRTTLERYANAMQRMIERHDILRTAIFWDHLSESAQVVFRQVPSPLIKITMDESGKPALDQLSHAFNPRQYRLDLTQAPLLRLMAVPESDGSWVAVQLMHNSIIDNLTLERLQAEIHAIMNGKIEILAASTPFRQFVAQARLACKPAEHTRFFTEMLGDIYEPTLPFGLSIIDQNGVEINEAHSKLSQTFNNQLRSHARNLQVSVASICHLAWAQVLTKASGREAVVFGTSVVGRLETEEGNTDNIIGPMINTLPLRLNVNERGVETVVRDTHNRLSALLSHEYAPPVLVQRCSGVPADLPLFCALLNYRNNQKSVPIKKVLNGVSFMDNFGQTNYPLTMSVSDNDYDLCLTAQVVSPISAAQICGYMKQALESLVDALNCAPQQSIKKLKVMPSDERTLLMHRWNQATATHLPVCCIHQLFEAQVEYDGQAIAVECKGHTVSCSELNTQANRLAHYLIAQGVKPDDRIALCVERGIAMIVAILGILKAGCAYVPLDSAYPSQRLTSILLDADPAFLLTDSSGRNVLGDHQIPVIDLEKPLPCDLPIDNPEPNNLGLTSTHLAYVIYTSGSTGTPKGVMVEHQQVIRLFGTTHDQFGFNKQDKWALFHSFSFDVSIWEIMSTLCYGSQLLIVPHTTIQSMDEFYQWICINGITVLNQTPSAFKILMRVMNNSIRSNRLRYIVFVGEEFDPMIAKEWYEKYEKSGTILINIYGPTETTVYVTFQQIKTSKQICTIGRPLPDISVYLLDSHGEPVLVGIDGEMFISGAGVARGYFKRPDLTTERFLFDPFHIDRATRMYRTGDLARYLPDGNLVFLGRADQQLKIRGFRIELGEIEARLIEHPDVQEAVVQPFGDGSDMRIVAYIISTSDESLAQKLRSYLSTLLPDYMVPAAYVRLLSLPLTPNGKLNRRALPGPNDDAFARQQYDAPQGDMEEKLVQIWRDMLSIDRISRHDNFFALGGHSLLVPQLLTNLRQVGLDTTVREVFDTPTLAMLALTLSNYKPMTIPPNLITKDTTKITPEMLPLITLSQADIDTIIAQVPGGVANIQDIYGLTPLQNGMLYHHIMARRGDPYLLVTRLRFIDRTSLERYAHAVQQLIERYDILRTAIIWDGLSEPAEVVLRRFPSFLTEITLDESNQPVLEQLDQKFNLCQYRLDLTQAPLIRLMASSECNGNWVAVQLMHHSIGDYLSLEKLQADIKAIMDGKIAEIAMSTPFRQFVAQARLGISPAEHTRFFTEMLGDIDEPTLPFGMSDVSQDGFEVNETYLDISQTLNDQLRVHARNLQVSLASICHLAWAQVLAKTSGRKTVVFGTVLLGRLQAGEGNDDVMGPMINTLPLRLDIDERSVETAVRDTHTRLSALLTHEHASLVLAQRCSGVPTGSPLFSALLNYRHNQKNEDAKTLLPGVSVINAEERTNYRLALSVEANPSTLGLTAQVVSSISAARICAYMQQSLKSLVDTLNHLPQQQAHKLKVMPPDERTLLLHSWNQTTMTHSPVCCLHQLFEAQVECDGQAIAVECDGHTLTYSELNIQANRLAHYLIARGVKPNDRIAICVERSTSMIVGILGILKAGCAYVPLDPKYPSQRMNNILLDADPMFLLADSIGRNAVGDYQIQKIDLEKPLSFELSIDNPDIAKLGLMPAHLAYIIYTSGSTGKPKGVMVEHQSAVQFFETIHNKFGFNRRDKWCLFHSVSFDISVWEMFTSLGYGSQLLIAPYKITCSPNEFYDWICINGITVLTQTSSALKMLIRERNTSTRFNRLRLIAFGAETSDPNIVKDWYEKDEHGQTILVNLYGPTETLMVATGWICDINTSKHSNIPIGGQLQNRRIYLLDSQGEPVPIGVEGEIYIGGNIIARGYLNRPELTAERFLPDPFSDTPEARMYRTGDLAQYFPDGNLVFLGRVDEQVKIRGFRIELGEIEARLVEHPQVHEAVVQPYGDETNMRLVAYIIADIDKGLAQILRAYLLTVLPDYMVPAAYVCLPSFPLTINGKLDRRALPAPKDEAFVRQQYEVPQGEIEEKLAQIWSELLNIDRISRHDNFFELGGHSLLVMSFVNKTKLHKINIDARDVYSMPILKNLAEKIANNSKRVFSDVAIPIRQHGNETPLFLFPDGGGDISHTFELAHDIDKNIPVYVLQWSSPESKQPSSIEEMATAMIPRIRKVQPNGPYSLAGYCTGGILAYEIAKQLIKSGCSVSFLGLIDTYASFSTLSETEIFIGFLLWTFPIFETINDSIWWDLISKLELDEAVEEIRKINLNLNNPVDIEWELLLMKQRLNYQNMCAAYKIDSMPIKIHLFKAVELCMDYFYKRDLEGAKKCFSYPKLGWENYNVSLDFNVIPVDGNHNTILTNPNNRSLLGEQLTKFLQQNKLE